MKVEATASVRSRVSRRMPAILSMLGLALLFAGCAGTEVDEKRAREAILYDVEQKTGTAIERVSCPSGVKVVPGVTFECRIEARDGREAIATMEILNEDADVRFVSLRSATVQEKPGRSADQG